MGADNSNNNATLHAVLHALDPEHVNKTTHNVSQRAGGLIASCVFDGVSALPFGTWRGHEKPLHPCPSPPGVEAKTNLPFNGWLEGGRRRMTTIRHRPGWGPGGSPEACPRGRWGGGSVRDGGHPPPAKVGPGESRGGVGSPRGPGGPVPDGGHP